jgi:DNA-binding transcriptional ArsR family regulator
LAETDDYDRIFSALKHPIRRQILLFLENKGEASFAEIQKDQSIDDTGLLSYHLKELTPLIMQSVRGRYSLSETGRASLALFKKVEAERHSVGEAVQREMEKLASKIVFLFLILGAGLMAPLSVDVYFSVQYVGLAALSTEQIAVILLASLVGMILSLVLFVIYDQHYFGRDLRKNVVHALLFALGVSFLSFLSSFAVYSFQAGTLNVTSMPSAVDANMILVLGILRIASFIGITPVMTYSLVKKLRLRK